MTTATTERLADERAAAGTLKMVQIGLDQQEMAAWMAHRGVDDQDLALHCLLTECLGELRPRVFRATPAASGRQPAVLGYCRSSQEELESSIQALATPLQRAVIKPGEVRTKEMPRDWVPGGLLGFEIRVRPLVRLERRPGHGHPGIIRRRQSERGLEPGHECDVHRWRRIIDEEEGGETPTRDRVYAAWLAGKAEAQGGCIIDPRQVVMSRFSQTLAVRKLGRSGIPGPDAVLRGILQVADPDRFEDLLERGLGRHRAYGYGMILLRPVMHPRG